MCSYNAENTVPPPKNDAKLGLQIAVTVMYLSRIMYFSDHIISHIFYTFVIVNEIHHIVCENDFLKLISESFRFR